MTVDLSDVFKEMIPEQPNIKPPITFPLKPKRGRPFGSKTKKRNPNKPSQGRQDDDYWYYLGSEISRLIILEKEKSPYCRHPIHRIIQDFVYRERGKPGMNSITMHAVEKAYYVAAEVMLRGGSRRPCQEQVARTLHT